MTKPKIDTSSVDWDAYMAAHQEEIRELQATTTRTRNMSSERLAQKLYGEPYVGMSQREQNLAALYMRAIEPNELVQERAINIASRNAGTSLEKALSFLNHQVQKNEQVTMTRKTTRTATGTAKRTKRDSSAKKYPVGTYFTELPQNYAIMHESKTEQFQRETREAGQWRVYRSYVASERSWHRAHHTVNAITSGDGIWAPEGSWDAQLCRPADAPDQYLIVIKWAGANHDA